jgi:hypothetical protein
MDEQVPIPKEIYLGQIFHSFTAKVTETQGFIAHTEVRVTTVYTEWNAYALLRYCTHQQWPNPESNFAFPQDALLSFAHPYCSPTGPASNAQQPTAHAPSLSASVCSAALSGSRVIRTSCVVASSSCIPSTQGHRHLAKQIQQCEAGSPTPSMPSSVHP